MASDSERGTSTANIDARSMPSQSCVMASLLTRIREDSSAARSRDGTLVAAVTATNRPSTTTPTSTQPSPTS